MPSPPKPDPMMATVGGRTPGASGRGRRRATVTTRSRTSLVVGVMEGDGIASAPS